MKIRQVVLVMSITGGLFLAGCCQQARQATETPAPAIDQDQVNRDVLASYSDKAIRNAVIEQHTLYPYHFVNNSATLTPLGQRDLSILIEHFKEYPGSLTVQQGSADHALYQARRQAIYETLMLGGIPQDAIEMTDALPGGDGMPSGEVIEVLRTARQSGRSAPSPRGTMEIAF